MTTDSKRLYQVDIPEGVSGDWRVERFAVNKDEAMLSSLRDPRRHVSPGTYTRLVRGNTVVMSDTPAEIRDHWAPIGRARNRCRVHGLGLGMVVAAILDKPEVSLVEVVERSQDVIDLVYPTLEARYGDRLQLIHSDVLTGHPLSSERGYDMIWHDIWDDMSESNLPQMTLLHKRWARRTLWQGSWGKEEILRRRRYWANRLG